MTTSQIPAADAGPGVDVEELGRHIAEMYRAVANRAQHTSDKYGAHTIELLAAKPTEESSR
jgi:hypothetical protein